MNFVRSIDARRRPHRLLLALVAVLALLATSCGGSDSEDTTSSSDSTETADASASSSDEGSADDASSEDASADVVEATIGIANIAPITALELVKSGFTEGMEACAGVDATIDYRNAEGDGSQIAPIVAEFLDSDVDLILAISTPVLQATVAANETDGRGTPVLFGAVTNPFAAGAAEGPDNKPEWLTGWQADAPVTGMFDVATMINPDASVIGIAYDPSQVNSEVAVAKMQAEAETRGWTVETATIGDSSEVGTASNALASRDIDFFFVPTDSILVNGLSGMAQVADDFDIPMIAQDSGIAAAGAAIGTGLDYEGDGRRNAEYACEILQGNATPADYPIKQFEKELVAYNSAAAEAQGFEIPQSILDNGIDLG